MWSSILRKVKLSSEIDLDLLEFLHYAKQTSIFQWNEQKENAVYLFYNTKNMNIIHINRRIIKKLKYPGIQISLFCVYRTRLM